MEKFLGSEYSPADDNRNQATNDKQVQEGWKSDPDRMQSVQEGTNCLPRQQAPSRDHRETATQNATGGPRGQRKGFWSHQKAWKLKAEIPGRNQVKNQNLTGIGPRTICVLEMAEKFQVVTTSLFRARCANTCI